MKKIYTTIITAIFPLLLSAGAGSPDVRAHGLKFAKDGANLQVDMNIDIKAEGLGKNQAIIITPVISGGTNSAELPQVVVNGRRKDQQYRRRVRFGADMPEVYSTVKTRASVSESVRYSATVPYEGWMDGASVYLKKSVAGCAGCEDALGEDLAGNVLIPVRVPYEVKPQVSRLEYAAEPVDRKMEESPYLDFRIGSASIVSTFGDNADEIGKIADIIGKIEREAEIELDRVHISGYASPDGGYAINERLAYERAQNVKNYFLSRYDIPSSRIEVESFSEDWDGLRAMVADSRLVQREQILAIIDSGDKPDVKEQRLTALGIVYQTMLDKMFPKLRRVYCRVDFTVRDYTPQAAAALRKKDPETLTQRELFILAQSYDAGSAERENIYDQILRLYPDDIVAIVNTSATMLEGGKDELAKRCLDRAADDPKAANNLGVYYLKAGDLSKAEALLLKAKAAGIKEADHNLNELRLKRADNENDKK